MAYKPRRRVPRKRTIRKTGRKSVAPALRRAVTSVLNRNLETKFITNEFNNIQFNSAISSGTECYPCYPSIGPGTGSWQRIGNMITPIRVKNNWVISLSPVARSENLICDLFILIDKNNRFFPDIPLSGVPQFLKSGNSFNNQSYNGINTDAFKKINTERYTLLKHFRFQLVSNVGNANNDTVPGNVPNVAGQSLKQLSYIVDAPKQLKYDPTKTSPDYPLGHAPFWVLGYSKSDGTNPDVTFQSVTVSHSVQMLYKDA